MDVIDPLVEFISEEFEFCSVIKSQAWRLVLSFGNSAHRFNKYVFWVGNGLVVRGRFLSDDFGNLDFYCNLHDPEFFVKFGERIKSLVSVLKI